MTYNELITALKSYLETDEATFVSMIPTFVKNVENRIYNEVQLPALRSSVTGHCTTNLNYLDTPADFLAPYALAIIDPATQEYDYIRFVDVNLVREVYPTPTVTGAPKVYGLYDSKTFILGPTPDKDYGAELQYFYYPESLTTVASGETWISKNFPSVLLYGCLSEGYRFQKGDQTMQDTYDKQYEAALNLLRKLGEGKDRGDQYRDGQQKLRGAT